MSQEGFAEIPARELVSLWFADKTGDAETAHHLRESSMAPWGLPKQRWVEAKEGRKLAKQYALDRSASLRLPAAVRSTALQPARWGRTSTTRQPCAPRLLALRRIWAGRVPPL